ncbi:hypothetical protein C8R47DRAFT_177987 [Mycena vitilis]|nr:hypothetical protein C8R47DRAFT_177987 [Mycena vitilis]
MLQAGGGPESTDRCPSFVIWICAVATILPLLEPFTGFLCCTQLSLTSTMMDGSGANLPWAQLRCLTLTNGLPKEYNLLLQMSHNLVHCTLDLLVDNNFNPPDITLLSLKSLTLIRVDWEDPCDGYLETFIVPAPSSLRLYDLYVPISTLASFISKSGCKLDNVCIADSESICASIQDSYRSTSPTIPKFPTKRKPRPDSALVRPHWHQDRT